MGSSTLRPSTYVRGRVVGLLLGALIASSGGCECFMDPYELDDDDPLPPAPPHPGGCFEPSDWTGKSCDMLCTGGEGRYPRRCVEDGCASTVVGYRIWDACYYGEPAEQTFPLDLGCSDILDASLADDYQYVACCCEEYVVATDSGAESESGSGSESG